jgi:hypothetical protein
MQIGDEVVFNTGAGPEPRAVIRGYIKHIALSNDSDPYELQPAITNITHTNSTERRATHNRHRPHPANATQ